MKCKMWRPNVTNKKFQVQNKENKKGKRDNMPGEE